MPSQQCLVCHDETSGLLPEAQVSRRFCDQCHGRQRREENWNHGPVNLGDCLPCHRAGHEAPYPRLLDMPIPELCEYCHNEQAKKQMPFHKAKVLLVDIDNCVACHDPHRVY
jgi:predicted CXXCH cytochrome family protein